MINLQAGMPSDFKVGVTTTEGRGLSPEEWAGMCADKLMVISDNAHPAIQAQARAFKAQMAAVITAYMKHALHSDRTTLYNMLEKQGHKDMAEILRRL